MTQPLTNQIAIGQKKIFFVKDIFCFVLILLWVSAIQAEIIDETRKMYAELLFYAVFFFVRKLFIRIPRLKIAWKLE